MARMGAINAQLLQTEAHNSVHVLGSGQPTAHPVPTSYRPRTANRHLEISLQRQQERTNVASPNPANSATNGMATARSELWPSVSIGQGDQNSLAY